MDYLYWYKAYVTKVYDGDSITVDIDLGFDVILKNTKIILADIDTPEIRGDERENGLISRDWLTNKILNKWISIKTIKDTTGKYGRYLAYIYIDGENINETLLKEGLAKKYE
jgi:micrococcal nuclease